MGKETLPHPGQLFQIVTKCMSKIGTRRRDGKSWPGRNYIWMCGPTDSAFPRGNSESSICVLTPEVGRIYRYKQVYILFCLALIKTMQIKVLTW